MSDFMYFVLALSVTFNVYLIVRVTGMGKAMISIDKMLHAVARGEAKIVLGDDNDWHVKKVK